jgi:hypothetical protein
LGPRTCFMRRNWIGGKAMFDVRREECFKKWDFLSPKIQFEALSLGCPAFVVGSMARWAVDQVARSGRFE